MALNFDLAPPAKTVDGLFAVPIDIQKITASLTFDAATSSGKGDATVEFTMGPQNGNPIFDLRQTITDIWLDGVSLPVAQAAEHDFGGGPDAQLRIVQSTLTAGSTHVLRVKYDLGLPQASTAGSYQPHMTFSAGPRLVFNFGFTDLGAGRYLEAWIPANLIFDQFEIALTLQILNTGITHTVITNGTVTPLGINHWSVAFPARFTALSTLLELRATDTLNSHSDTVALPISGNVVTIEAWKLTSNAANLTDQVNNLKTFLVANENSTGSYLHGNRFVAFINAGGMEYEGGTTSGTGSLKHETFHSWWARGVKPASQPDGWWDEAWTVYNTDPGIAPFPFDFTAPPVTLCTRNAWSRVTPLSAYSDGLRFFEGVASMIGAANLSSLMSDFYKTHRARPVTTMEIEEFLLSRSGNPLLVDAYHRFVYGFSNPSPAPDLWLRDDPAHTGPDVWGGTFWNSPDLWIRNKDDGGTVHQDPEFGQDNWFYARVRNRSATATANHFVVTFNVKTYAGTEFTYPTDFLPCIAAVSGFGLGPGASTIVKARWPRAAVPPKGTHACWLAAVLTRSDQPVAGRHVWEHNNLAQKNLTIVDLKPNGWIILPFVVANLSTLATNKFRLEVIRPKNVPDLKASLVHTTGAPFVTTPAFPPQPFSLAQAPAPKDGAATNEEALDCGGMTRTGANDSPGVLTSDSAGSLTARRFDQAVELSFGPGAAAGIPISIRAGEQTVLGLRVSAPTNAKSGDVIRIDMVKRDESGKQIMGGVAVEIHVV
jgi:hypothetical protein